MSGRTCWVDSAKGVGIVLVVYGHVARGVERARLPIDENFYRIGDSVIYSFHMPLFFFLAGLFFVASLEKRGAAGTLANKLATLAYPYVVWSLIQGFGEIFLSRFTNGHVEIGEVLALLWRPRAQFWFLYALFFVTVAAIPIYRWLDRQWYPAVLAAAALAYLFADALPGGVPEGFVVRNFVFFAGGVWLADAERLPAAHARLLALATGAAFLACQFLIHGPAMKLFAAAGNAQSLGLAAVSVAAVVAACRWLGAGDNWLARIGRHSMVIYVMHILAGSGTRIILQKFLGIESPAIHLLLGTLAGLMLPLLALRAMTRMRLLFLLELPRRPVARAMQPLPNK